jgi:hypothetical protein
VKRPFTRVYAEDFEQLSVNAQIRPKSSRDSCRATAPQRQVAQRCRAALPGQELIKSQSGRLCVEIEAIYTPLEWNVIAHLAIRSVAPERAPLPITETGYLSHFHQPGDVTP